MKNCIYTTIAVILLVGMVSGITLAQETLNVWIMDPGSQEIYDFTEEANKKFEEEYGVKVDVNWIPWTSAHQKFITSIAGGVAPDVAEMGTTWTPEFAQMSALEDVADQVNSWPEIKDDLLPSLINAGTYNDVFCGVPWYVGIRALYYRQDWFEEKGLNPPKTWDDLINVSKEVQEDTDNDGNIDRYALAFYARSQHEWLPFVWQNGGKLAYQDEEGNWVSAMDQPEAVEAIKFYGDLYKKYNFIPDGAVSWALQDARQAFAMGDSAMYIGGSWDRSILYDMNSELKGNIGVTILPGKEKSASFAGGSHLVVFKQSDKKEAAFEYVRFLLSEKNQLKWAELTNFFPGRVSLYDNSRYQEDPFLKVFADQLEYSNTYPTTPLWSMVSGTNLFRNKMQEVFMGKSAEKAAEEIAEEMNKVFSNYQ